MHHVDGVHERHSTLDTLGSMDTTTWPTQATSPQRWLPFCNLAVHIREENPQQKKARKVQTGLESEKHIRKRWMQVQEELKQACEVRRASTGVLAAGSRPGKE